jgi:RNA polymerase sigma factor (sigma-70 family)
MLSNEEFSVKVEKSVTFNKLLNENIQKTLSNKELNVKVRRAEALGKILNPQEKEIISLRFGIPNGDDMTLEQVGKVLNLTRERVRQIQNKALDKLRGHPLLKSLKDFIQD